MLTLFPLHKHIGFQVVPTKMIMEIEIKITLLCIIDAKREQMYRPMQRTKII